MTLPDKLQVINELKEKADAIKPSKAWDQSFLERIKIEFTYRSNQIEGNTITYGQTVKLLKEMVTPKNAATGEVFDMVNHQRVLDIVFRDYHQREIAVDTILELHRAMMRNVEQWADDGLYSPGQYKTFENATVRSSGKVHHYQQPIDVAPAMQELIAETNRRMAASDNNNPDQHPLVIATYFHQQFLNVIHPFADGNGRIGRLFTNLILIKKGFPPIFITDINRNDYLDCFERSESDPGAMADFLADRLIESLEVKIDFLSQEGTAPSIDPTS